MSLQVLEKKCKILSLGTPKPKTIHLIDKQFSSSPQFAASENRIQDSGHWNIMLIIHKEDNRTQSPVVRCQQWTVDADFTLQLLAQTLLVALNLYNEWKHSRQLVESKWFYQGNRIVAVWPSG
jgi:hypothetical protein